MVIGFPNYKFIRREIAMKFCTKCGKELFDEAVICPGCGCPVAGRTAPVQPYQQSYQPQQSYQNQQNYQPQQDSAIGSIILGSLGIIAAWIFALIGHIMSIIGIVLGVKEYKRTGKMAGLVLSVIGEICSLLSSFIGVMLVMGM